MDLFYHFRFLKIKSKMAENRLVTTDYKDR